MQWLLLVAGIRCDPFRKKEKKTAVCATRVFAKRLLVGTRLVFLDRLSSLSCCSSVLRDTDWVVEGVGGRRRRGRQDGAGLKRVIRHAPVVSISVNKA